MAEIVSSAKFGLNAEKIDELKSQGVIIHDEIDEEALDVPEPAYGETVLGEATDEEMLVFYNLHQISHDMEDMLRQHVSEGLQRMGKSLRDTDRSKSFWEQVQSIGEEMTFTDEEVAKRYFRLQQTQLMLKSYFYWAVGERFNYHDHQLGVRSKRRIVSIERRW